MTKDELRNMSKNDVYHALYIFGFDGYQPGSFTENLLKAAMTADSMNFARLKAAFPGEMAAFELVRDGNWSTIDRFLEGKISFEN